MSRKKRYVFIIGTLASGGAERVISILADKMVEMNEDVTILMYYTEKVFYDLSPKIRLVFLEKETGTRNKVKNIIWLRRFIKENADVVLSFLATINILVLTATRGLKKTVIVADRNDPYKVPEHRVIRFVRDVSYHFANGIVFQTKHNQEYFSKTIRDRSTVIYNPVDEDKLAKVVYKAKKKRIVSVGRLIEQKNQKLLLNAFSLIHNEFPDYSLTIYGEGCERKELCSMVEKQLLNDCVFLPGNSSSVLQEIVDAELFVLSSNYEGMSNALIEAMCLGIPVISTKVSGSIDLIRSDYNGILVDCDNINELADAMRIMLSNDDYRVCCGRNAARIKESLLPNVIISKWIDYIKKIENKK